MSRFLRESLQSLAPYVPGEQPKEKLLMKLNTNEMAYPPSQKAQQRAAEAAKQLELYPDPTCSRLTNLMAKNFGIKPEQILLGNGSDEILYFSFLAFCSEKKGAIFPNITYGFYPVYARFCSIPFVEVPLKEDFSIDPADYFGNDKMVVIANPNAPTGLALSLEQIEEILKHNPDQVVLIDEAYADFSGKTCLSLIDQYDNLLVVQTFSKSRSMAGARLGMAMGSSALIEDLNRVKFSINPFNVNAMTMAAGIGVMEDEEYTKSCCQKIVESREWLAEELKALGFAVIPSKTNFLFAKHPKMGGKELNLALRERGVLVRHFGLNEIKDYNRITIGRQEQMVQLVEILKEILEEAE